MKGIIANCVRDLVQKKFGEDKWREIHERCGRPSATQFLAGATMDEEAFGTLLQHCMDVLGVGPRPLFEAFAAHWVHDVAARTYKVYYKRASTAKEFIENLDGVHAEITRSMQEAHPPRFALDWKDDKTLVMEYRSERDLVDLAVALLEEVGVYFGEPLDISLLDRTHVRIRFP